MPSVFFLARVRKVSEKVEDAFDEYTKETLEHLLQTEHARLNLGHASRHLEDSEILERKVGADGWGYVFARIGSGSITNIIAQYMLLTGKVKEMSLGTLESTVWENGHYVINHWLDHIALVEKGRMDGTNILAVFTEEELHQRRKKGILSSLSTPLQKMEATEPVPAREPDARTKTDGSFVDQLAPEAAEYLATNVALLNTREAELASAMEKLTKLEQEKSELLATNAKLKSERGQEIVSNIDSVTQEISELLGDSAMPADKMQAAMRQMSEALKSLPSDKISMAMEGLKAIKLNAGANAKKMETLAFTHGMREKEERHFKNIEMLKSRVQSTPASLTLPIGTSGRPQGFAAEFLKTAGDYNAITDEIRQPKRPRYQQE